MYLRKITTGLLFGTILMHAGTVFARATQFCYEGSCQSATHFEQSQVIEKLVAMFQKNSEQILICQADAAQRKCQGKPLTFSGQTNLMQVNFQVPFIRVLQKERHLNSLTLALDYQIKANEMYPVCGQSVSNLGLSKKGELYLTSPSFNCQATELGQTSLSFQFRIDYVDFDTGWMGGNYYATSSGDVVAEGSGYVMMQVSAERSIPLKRIQPYDTYGNDGGYYQAPSFQNLDEEPSGRLFSWDWDNIKEKWHNLKEKALKVIYLEPLND